MYNNWVADVNTRYVIYGKLFIGVSDIHLWAYLKGVSSMTLFHYLWRSLDPFSLSRAQTWP